MEAALSCQYDDIPDHGHEMMDSILAQPLLCNQSLKWHDNISESSMHSYMQVRYASSTNLSSGRCSCISEYFAESAGSEVGVHHTAAGDIQGEEETVAVKPVY